MAAIYPGAKPAILTQFSSPSSCYSKPRSPRWSPIIINGSADFLISLQSRALIIINGSADFLISLQSRALRKTMYFMPGRDSAITIALGIFVPPPGLCGTGTTGFCRAISPPFGNCPVLAAILRTQSRPLLSINRSQLSKQTAPVCWPACLTYASRLILQSVVKSSGRTPRNLFRGAMQRVSIKKSKPRTKRLVERHAFVVSNGRVLLEQSSARWRGMWILPPLKLDGLKPSSFQAPAIHVSTFPFTHHQITLAVYRRATPNRIRPTQRWFESIEHTFCVEL